MADVLFVKVDFQNGDNAAPMFISEITNGIAKLESAAAETFTYSWDQTAITYIEANEIADAVSDARDIFAGNELTNNARVYIDVVTIP